VGEGGGALSRAMGRLVALPLLLKVVYLTGNLPTSHIRQLRRLSNLCAG
jgi:hypothetical protein